LLVVDSMVVTEDKFWNLWKEEEEEEKVVVVE
jgi:hypothetical protein